MTAEQMLEHADDMERQAMVLVKFMYGGFDRVMISEAADLFTVAAALRSRAAILKQGEVG